MYPGPLDSTQGRDGDEPISWNLKSEVVRAGTAEQSRPLPCTLNSLNFTSVIQFLGWSVYLGPFRYFSPENANTRTIVFDSVF